VKTENSSACVTVNCIAVVPVVRSGVYKLSINPIIQYIGDSNGVVVKALELYSRGARFESKQPGRPLS
jgi:hypothetical protein